MNLWRITFTGIDESSKPRDLLELLRREPRLELGILFSDTQVGQGRYPSHRWIESITAEFARFNCPFALHVCGSARRRFLSDGRLSGFEALPRFRRVQLNGQFTEEQASQLQQILDASTAHFPALITQHDATPWLTQRVRHEHHQVLFDASGGNGVLRETWPAPLPGKSCGYAGGLGPATLERALPQIWQVAGATPFWIDMESSLRSDDDQFSFDAAHRVLDLIQELTPAKGRSLTKSVG